MTSSLNEAYTCYIPTVTKSPDKNTVSLSKRAIITHHSFFYFLATINTTLAQRNNGKTPTDMLRPLTGQCAYRVRPCLYCLVYAIIMLTHHNTKVEAYWMFEYCYGSHVRQYHEEEVDRVPPASTRTAHSLACQVVKNGQKVRQPSPKLDFYLGKSAQV